MSMMPLALTKWARSVNQLMSLSSAVPSDRKEFSIPIGGWLKQRGFDPDRVTVKSVVTSEEQIVIEVESKPDACFVEIRQLRLDFADLPIGETPSREELAKRLTAAVPALPPDRVRAIGPVGPDGVALIDIFPAMIVLAPAAVSPVLALIDQLRGRTASGDPVADLRASQDQDLARMRELGVQEDQIAVMAQLHEQQLGLLKDALRTTRDPVITNELAPLAKAGSFSIAEVRAKIAAWIGEGPTVLTVDTLFGIESGDVASLKHMLHQKATDQPVKVGDILEAELVRLGYQPSDRSGWRWHRAAIEESKIPWWRSGLPADILRIEEMPDGKPPHLYVAWDTSAAKFGELDDLVRGKSPMAIVVRDLPWGVFQGELAHVKNLRTQVEALVWIAKNAAAVKPDLPAMGARSHPPEKPIK